MFWNGYVYFLLPDGERTVHQCADVLWHRGLFTCVYKPSLWTTHQLTGGQSSSVQHGFSLSCHCSCHKGTLGIYFFINFYLKPGLFTKKKQHLNDFYFINTSWKFTKKCDCPGIPIFERIQCQSLFSSRKFRKLLQ